MSARHSADVMMSLHKRRRYTSEFKLRILVEAEHCVARGELAALLKREGLYSSHLVAWRRQQAAAMQGALEPKKRGRKPRGTGEIVGPEIESMRTQYERLERQVDELT